jgi:hypothetical protein
VNAGVTSAAVEAHLAGCESCRRDEAERLPLRALLAPIGTAPDPLFVPAVLSRVRSGPSPLRRRDLERRAVRAVTAIAAVLLVAIVALLDPASPRPGAPAAPQASNEGIRPDEFLLGGSNGYLTCEWIPSAPPSVAESAEVAF